jgi:DNA modification methylase
MRCILCGTAEGDVVLDPFVGSGTSCRVANRYGRQYIGD